jgi:cytochrome oxidase Cu insertion factor (SCO1/SenC/PrrC family)
MSQQQSTKPFNRKFVRLAIIGVTTGLGILAGLTYFFKNSPKTYVQQQTTSLPKLGGPFSLTDQFGKHHTDQEFKGKYQMIYFGYSFCPDVCPMGLQHMSKGLELLGTDIDQVVPIFITIDPERDNVESLHQYAQNWHSSFLFLTGSQEQLQPVLKAFKVYAVKAKPDGTLADYLMDHSALIYLMDRSGQLVDFCPHTTEPEAIAAMIRKHLLKEKQPH